MFCWKRKSENNNKQDDDETSAFLTVQLTFLKFGGILPSKSIFNSPLKIKIYNFFATISMLWYIPIVVAQGVAAYQHWGNVSFVTGLLFESAAVLNNLMISSYLMMNRHKISSIICKVNSAFKNQTEQLPFEEKHQQSLSDASNKNLKFAWILIITNILSSTLWVLVPFLLWYTYDGDDIYEHDESQEKEIHWEFFSQKSWLPSNVYETPYYQIIWFYQTVPVYSILINFTGYNMFFYSVTTFASTHFQILADLLRNANKYIESTTLIQSSLEHQALTRGNLNTENEHIQVSDVHELNISDENMHGKMEIKSEFNYSINKNERKETYQDVAYLVKCLKYHQALLEFCADVQNLFGPILFIFFCMNGIMMCITVFQATLPSEEEGFIKFSMASLSCWFPIFLLCWYGDHLTIQSLEIEERAYGCLWYNSSTTFKKILQFLIKRSQEPVQLNGGGVFPISLKGFADIANNVYAYYTILKKMQQA
ncbi:Odorant receptor 15 [Blattella germanica]|nr:Odorant receptor 15 [Blattella germanica]